MIQLKTKSNGQSLTEYSLVIGLVTLATIAGVAVLATNIQQNMTEAVAQNTAPINNNPTLVSQNLSAPNALVAAGQGGTRLPSNSLLPTEKLCISGVCANFPIVNTQNDLVDVAAGNGADKILQFSKVLMEMAESIEDNLGDPGLASQIRQLAHTGHSLGDLQNAVFTNSSSTQGTNAKSAVSQVLHKQGKEDFKAYQKDLKIFNEQFQNLEQALNSRGEKYSSIVKNLILDNALQIQQIGNGLTINTNLGGSINNVKVKLTHQSANTICGQQSQQDCIRKPSVESASRQ